ncbi:hypothetical protein G6F57_023199 [Rhizopus arrhizus]|nr:hypothetical protein G6F57_023199 [Rhizopus arrhizus]
MLPTRPVSSTKNTSTDTPSETLTGRGNRSRLYFISILATANVDKLPRNATAKTPDSELVSPPTMAYRVILKIKNAKTMY